MHYPCSPPIQTFFSLQVALSFPMSSLSQSMCFCSRAGCIHRPLFDCDHLIPS
jgi:hypothetical protein